MPSSRASAARKVTGRASASFRASQLNRTCKHCGKICKTPQALRPHEKSCAKREQHCGKIRKTVQALRPHEKFGAKSCAETFCSCVCRTPLSDANGILRYLEEGELLKILDGPFVDRQSHVAKIRARALRDGAIGWATMKTKEGWVLRAAHRPMFKCKCSMILYDVPQCSQEKIGEVMPNEVVEIIEGPYDGHANCSTKVRLPCGTVGWLVVSDIGMFVPWRHGLATYYPELLCLATQWP